MPGYPFKEEETSCVGTRPGEGNGWKQGTEMEEEGRHSELGEERQQESPQGWSLGSRDLAAPRGQREGGVSVGLGPRSVVSLGPSLKKTLHQEFPCVP